MIKPTTAPAEEQVDPVESLAQTIGLMAANRKLLGGMGRSSDWSTLLEDLEAGHYFA